MLKKKNGNVALTFLRIKKTEMKNSVDELDSKLKGEKKESANMKREHRKSPV